MTPGREKGGKETGLSLLECTWANLVGAVFTQSETGSDRYSLLENFNDVSNADNSNSPGNMDYWSFSQPFQDPILDEFFAATLGPAGIIGANIGAANPEIIGGILGTPDGLNPFVAGLLAGPPAGGEDWLPLWGPWRLRGAAVADVLNNDPNGAMNKFGNAAFIDFIETGIVLLVVFMPKP